jgi:hypothetical protein
MQPQRQNEAGSAAIRRRPGRLSRGRRDLDDQRARRNHPAAADDLGRNGHERRYDNRFHGAGHRDGNHHHRPTGNDRRNIADVVDGFPIGLHARAETASAANRAATTADEFLSNRHSGATDND